MTQRKGIRMAKSDLPFSHFSCFFAKKLTSHRTTKGRPEKIERRNGVWYLAKALNGLARPCAVFVCLRMIWFCMHANVQKKSVQGNWKRWIE
jgi:hypothetical protein